MGRGVGRERGRERGGGRSPFPGIVWWERASGAGQVRDDRG